ncbi:cation diffusion facilitator family transporter [Roseospira marina]|uniref:Cation-efflux pump FieF n=1 Tax=Roseospira marina TaxID=140057 RepID=A0A5M6I9P3_9PROT|nr:cation diffusion facilitator family transporter [Roseospira marina]KAA5604882.1 cation diffusion facilitator family transporter [Roseospira marina]MBB4315219.1 ferrous-iron efflux pump FieF [Roseospira marina]MBB5088219.1 ferrous-iron efflux pump FieF [Roseospira marina]
MTPDAAPTQTGLGRAFSGPPESERLMRWATYAAVGTAVTLILFKLVAWSLTGSLSLLSTLVDSVLDAAASLLNLYAVRVALEPADHDHRFGHGKAEPLAGLAQAAFIGGSALFLLVEAGSRFLDPVPLAHSGVGVAVMVVSITATLGLVLFQRHVVRRTRSVAISADSMHYAGDVLINLSVIASLLLTQWAGLTWADPAFATAIAAYLLFTGWTILRTALSLLMDKEFEEPDRLRILDIARDHPDVHDAHDLRTRSSGQQAFIQLHLEMDRDFPLWKAHRIAEQVERRVRHAFPDADVLIHQDPTGIAEAHPSLAYEDGTDPNHAEPGTSAPG